MDKVGADKFLSVYWFAILVIVAGGVVAMVLNFYGNPYDVRDVEASRMINQIADCLSDGEKLNSDLLNENLLENCHLNFEVEEQWEQGQYYVEVQGVSAGNSNLKDFCNLNEKSVVCVDRNVYFLDENNQGTAIKILSVVRKAEKNVK